MAGRLEHEVAEMHKEITEIKEVLGIVMEDYVELMHSRLEKDGDKFISLEKYKKKHGIRS